jgi:ASC-1-like (ASCH) protein
MTTYTKHLSEPWFSLIKIGAKKCEGRLHKGDFALMKKDDYLLFENNDFNFLRSFRCKITSIHDYNTFENYLEGETLNKCLPGIDTIQQGVKIYREYYDEEQEAKYKIIAIRLRIVR